MQALLAGAAEPENLVFKDGFDQDQCCDQNRA
jgi:hypothetical protein